MKITKSTELGKSKKAQGMPINIIIIAAIALIVLVVLVVVFSGKFGKFGTGVDDTANSFKNMCEIPGTSRECVKAQKSEANLAIVKRKALVVSVVKNR
ncbi:hypothetical protein J4206_03715 [Candidatus Woesearchaeota archaeon]|nr:hypothetical protein [Candidatus Woesearchaeota archaeon]